jgi:hypothetical protein
MQELVAAIQCALTPESTPEARAVGAGACRTILTALEATPGAPMTAAVAAPPSPIAAVVAGLRGVPPDQLLDIAIARLRAALPADAQVDPVPPLKFHLIPLPRTGG